MIPKRTPAAFATGIIAAATINADNGVSAISNPVVNLQLHLQFFVALCLSPNPPTNAQASQIEQPHLGQPKRSARRCESLTIMASLRSIEPRSGEHGRR
jgi:hypothetical protein